MFEDKVKKVAEEITQMLILKNASYGNSALDPVRVFSKANSIEQLYVRIDDKLSRIARGGDFGNEDNINDLIGYLFLVKIKKREETGQ